MTVLVYFFFIETKQVSLFSLFNLQLTQLFMLDCIGKYIHSIMYNMHNMQAMYPSSCSSELMYRYCTNWQANKMYWSPVWLVAHLYHLLTCFGALPPSTAFSKRRRTLRANTINNPHLCFLFYIISGFKTYDPLATPRFIRIWHEDQYMQVPIEFSPFLFRSHWFWKR